MNALADPLLPASATVSSPSPSPPSFAAAALLVPTWSDLTEVRRRDMISALTTAARMLGLPPEVVPCDVAWLNGRLFKRPPAAFGMGAQRFRNLMSDLRAILRRLGLHAARGYGEAGLSSSWTAILEAISNPAQRAGLRSFARACAAQDIEPHQVTDSTLAAFVAEEATTRLSASVTDRAATIARAWNKAAEATPGDMALPRLAAPARRQPYTLPFEAYPASFQADVRRFHDRLACDEGRFVLAADGPRRRARPATLKVRLFAVRQAAAALVIDGLAPGAIGSLRDLVEPVERVGRILDYFHARAAQAAAGRRGETGQPVGGQLAVIAETLRQVAKYHVGLTGPDLQQIEAWSRQALPRRQRGLSGKQRDRLRRLIAPRPRALLLHLPAELLRRARLPDQDPEVAARLAMLATAIEILLICPMRMKNLAGLRLDRHLQRIDGRGRRISHLILVESETKNSEPLEWPVPLESAKLIEAYIRDFRPALATDPNLHLFPGKGDAARTQNALAGAISDIIDRLVGVAVHPHLMRHFAAWLYLKAHPGQYEMVRRVLGHKSVETTITMYCGLEAGAAAEQFDAEVLRQRVATRPVAAAWRRPGRRAGGKP